MCFGCSKEPSHLDGSFEYPQYTFWLRNKENDIGITHVFSCINICWVPRKMFEHEADMPSAQTSPEGPSKC